MILAAYARAVEAAFAALGPDQLDLFRETTGPYPVEVIEATAGPRSDPAGQSAGLVGAERSLAAVPALRPGAQLAGSPGRRASPFSVSA